MKTKYIVFFDIDHTLYDVHSKKIHTSSIEAIKKLNARKDTLIAIATGRAYYMLDVLAPIQAYIDLYITINGQLIYQNDRIIYDDPMPKALVKQAKESFKQHQLPYGFIGKHTQAIDQFNPRAKALFDKDDLAYPIEDPDFDQHQAVYQMWSFGDQSTMQKLQAAMKPLKLIPWLSEGFDVIDPHKTKSEGVLRVLKQLKLNPSQAICFGDGHNDIEMLKAIPTSFAMGQSHPDVLDAANHITDACDEDGIYNALKKIKLID